MKYECTVCGPEAGVTAAPPAEAFCTVDTSHPLMTVIDHQQNTREVEEQLGIYKVIAAALSDYTDWLGRQAYVVPNQLDGAKDAYMVLLNGMYNPNGAPEANA